MVSRKTAFTGIGIVLLIIVGSGCLEEQAPSDTLLDYAELTKAGQSCDDCHYVAFDYISTQGGNHSLDCKFCHIQHGFKPECSRCHEIVHGTTLQNCKDCHFVHAPLKKITSLSGNTFERSCSSCHTQQIEDFSENPSRHGDLKCIYCHPVHRQKIPCINCHAPHSIELTYNDCLTCHPPHMPQEVDYPEDISRNTCASCHEKENATLEEGRTKHNTLNCAFCHPVHKQIPECLNCHSPHTPKMTNNECIGCHPAHDPLDIEFDETTKREYCALCHEEINDILRGSNTKHDDLGCVYCHPKHGLLPGCESCHDLPHNQDIHDSFPSCNQCHIISHDVKNIIFNR